MAFTPGENPLRSVGGVTNLPAPSSPDGYVWELEDISAEGAGRTENKQMQKKRIGQNVALALKWAGLSLADTSKVLKAFNPEYISVTYLDPMVGDFKTAQFYVGNRTAPMYNGKLNLWENVSFRIITRNGDYIV